MDLFSWLQGNCVNGQLMPSQWEPPSQASTSPRRSAALHVADRHLSCTHCICAHTLYWCICKLGGSSTCNQHLCPPTQYIQCKECCPPVKGAACTRPPSLQVPADLDACCVSQAYPPTAVPQHWPEHQHQLYCSQSCVTSPPQVPADLDACCVSQAYPPTAVPQHWPQHKHQLYCSQMYITSPLQVPADLDACCVSQAYPPTAVPQHWPQHKHQKQQQLSVPEPPDLSSVLGPVQQVGFGV